MPPRLLRYGALMGPEWAGSESSCVAAGSSMWNLVGEPITRRGGAMRITAIETRGVGGLADGRLELPSSASVLALAGGNGTGKSKFLACMLALWTNQIPGPPDSTSEVRIEVSLSEAERFGLKEAAKLIGQGTVDIIPAEFPVTISRSPLGGVKRTADPDDYFLAYLWTNWPALIQQLPSLDVVYLPAERRLIESGNLAIDLAQLSEDVAQASIAAPRSAVQQYGRLDDGEFESYARALCVAATLPDDPESVGEEKAADAMARWEAFRETVNNLLEPKKLLQLTRQNPDRLLVQTPTGERHPVSELSSGERQALIIISRVLRAGSERRLVLIDEPDAYLHPHLSRRLIQALEKGVGESGQLIVATHSPAILDSMPFDAIVHLGHDAPPRLVASEEGRVVLYREAGFRASALTQSDLLVAVEGSGDASLLQLLVPELARATLTEAGGRPRVIEKVRALAPHDLPVLGLVDRDVDAPAIPGALSDRISVLPVADLEAAFLADDAALQIMIDRGLIEAEFATVPALRSVLDELMDGVKDTVISEIAQRSLRVATEWPAPRGSEPLTRLRAAVATFRSPTSQEVEDAITQATDRWNATTGQERWTLVRGKYILGEFVSRVSTMRNQRSLLEAVARARPQLVALTEFQARVVNMLG